MGLLSDFFLQIFFFATALAVDMGNVELRDAVRARRSHHGNMLDSSAATLVDGALLNGDAKRRRRKHFGHPISGPGLISSTTMTSAEGHMEETSNVMAPRLK